MKEGRDKEREGETHGRHMLVHVNRSHGYA
jgi:hypothetical protein